MRICVHDSSWGRGKGCSKGQKVIITYCTGTRRFVDTKICRVYKSLHKLFTESAAAEFNLR